MNSPKQIRFSSKPKPVTLAGGSGKNLSTPMVSSRTTPTAKTPAKIYTGR